MHGILFQLFLNSFLSADSQVNGWIDERISIMYKMMPNMQENSILPV